ncbi:MAG: TonB-dependent receptor [Opitutaceae bacterium]|nr:TonB-dependent receptor [Opitutaceae bacterium]
MASFRFPRQSLVIPRPLLAAALLFSIVRCVHAQSAPAASATEDEKVTLQKFVVTGALAGQAKAVQMQKQSDNLVNVVSSDKIGTFPDLNAAEALRRLPAVSLYFNSSGEGRFISIRGARPNYNGTLLNGFTVPSGDRSERTVDLQTLSNALIERIEVAKAATPDLPAEGIGGVTNIILNNPLNLADRTGRGSVYYGDNEYNGFEVRADASYGDFIDRDKKFAFQIATNYRRAERDLYETTIRDHAIRAGSGGTSVFLPGRNEYKFLQEEFYNYGIDLALGAKLSDRTEIEVRGFYSEFWRPSTRSSIEIGTIRPYMVGGAVVNLTPEGGLVTTVAEREWRTSDWYLHLYGGQFKSTTRLSDTLKLETGLAYHQAIESYKKDTTLTTDSATSPDPLQIKMTPHMVYFFPTSTASANAYNASSLRIRRWTYLPARKDEENELVPKFDLTKRFETAGTGTFDLKAGFYGRIREKQSEVETIRRNQNTGSNLTYGDLGTSQIVSNFDKKGFVQGTMPDYSTALNFVQNHESAFGAVQILNASGYATDSADFAADETIYAGYLMGTYKKDRITLIAGARYETTEEEFSRFSSTPGTGLVTTNDDYAHILPSVHLRYMLGKDLFLRTSWTETVGRPNPETIYGTLVIDRTNRTMNVPNPGLAALESRNIDASVEWYFGPLGQLMVGYFSKDIDNFAFSTQDTVTFEGQPFVRTQVQAKASGKISGWEASFRRTLDFLPPPFNGLGFDVNYAKLDSEVISPVRPDRPRLEMQPDEILNGSVFYAYDRFYIRLAMAHQGPMIDRAGTGASVNFDRYEAERTQWDISASYDLRQNVQVFAEWRNVTNEALEYIYPATNTLGVRRTFGTQIGAGVRLHF